MRRLVAAAVVAGSLAALVPPAQAAICRTYIIAGRAMRVCIPIEP